MVRARWDEAANGSRDQAIDAESALSVYMHVFMCACACAYVLKTSKCLKAPCGLTPKVHAPTLAILPIPISTVRQEMAGDNSGKASKISHQGGLALACAQSVLLQP